MVLALLLKGFYLSTEEKIKEAQYDTAELESELNRLRRNHRQRKADSVDNPKPFKKKRKWQFHYASPLRGCKWKRKRKDDDDDHSVKVKAESDSLKRPKGNDPEDTERENPDPVLQTPEDVHDDAKSNSFPKTSKFFPIFSRKPLIFFKLNPPKFDSKPLENEVNVPHKRKAKAKKVTRKKGTETTNTILDYFGATAAAKQNSNPP